MDEAFKQHSRRKGRSRKNSPNLSLAPLTSKLPINDLNPEEANLTPTTPVSRTYLEGKSAPTTPRLLSRTPSRSTARLPSAHLPKSKSATHLSQPARKADRRVVSGTTTPRRRRDDRSGAVDNDWLLRTGALMTTEAREYKGQAWLVSRASSTSLAAGRDPDSEDEDPIDRELEHERRVPSRSGSFADRSPPGASRSRPHSRAGTRTPVLSRAESDYFTHSPDVCEDMPGPDFVNLDERLEALGVEAAADDEAAVRRLVKRGQAGQDSWLANVLGWSLFSVEERDEESDGEEEEVIGPGPSSRSSSVRCLNRLEDEPEERVPPPAEGGAWGDAAWLLTVASKVLL